MEKIKLFIDTDMGGDVDDALALTAALRCPEVQVVGVSTVYLRPEWRAQVACNILNRNGYTDIPVAAGCGKPISGIWDERYIPDTGILPDMVCPLSELHGSDLLLQMAKTNPNMAVLAIGPLTNVALALMKAPSALKGCTLYIMGGRLFNARPEWNILCDPEAADIVLNSGLNIVLVPFDVTCQCQFTQEEVDQFTGTESREFLRTMMNSFTEKFGFLPIMHDPMALAMLVVPQLFTFERRQIAVEKNGALTRGTLVDFGLDPSGNVLAAVQVDQRAFRCWIMDHLFREKQEAAVNRKGAESNGK